MTEQGVELELRVFRHYMNAQGRETFGHEPVDEYAGTPEGARGGSRIVCARCMRWTRWSDVRLFCGRRVDWPCTSAVVLGLVARADTREGMR